MQDEGSRVGAELKGCQREREMKGEREREMKRERQLWPNLQNYTMASRESAELKGYKTESLDAQRRSSTLWTHPENKPPKLNYTSQLQNSNTNRGVASRCWAQAGERDRQRERETTLRAPPKLNYTTQTHHKAPRVGADTMKTKHEKKQIHISPAKCKHRTRRRE